MKRLPIATHGIYRDDEDCVPVRRACRESLERWHVPHALLRLETSLGATTVLTAGTNTGRPPVVLLPGAGLSAASTVATVCALYEHHRVLVPDLPGEPGLSSSRRPHRHAYDVYGRWLDELIPQLRPEPVIVVGHALGAAIALAATPSDRFAGLVLVNPAGITAIKRTWQLTRLRTKWMLHPTLDNSEQLLRYLSGSPFTPDMSLVCWYSMIAEHCFPGRLPRRLPARMIRRWAGEVPVIVADGECDPLLDRNRLRRRARSLLGVEVQLLAGCGHLGLREAPASVATLISALPAPGLHHKGSV
ncbi:alpha/beta hydrolase [Rhodococcus oxybenzonivorans]|uniref:Alpha/beta hydrolase n=1 Tax=Rhodococcus oxybenzonivorans TaxID=1990687 RepID=A0A2S2C201_9NOCA|nr:alpha/beta hydrolase [Rhodococcus oxybenzonivorans]AWK74917.1 alpha/beta hydrolase [Rhodococcus oxybenzonivorans]